MPRSGKNENFARSGNFLKSKEKPLILAKSVKSRGIPFSGYLQLISFLYDFSIDFLFKKTKCILQSKETDQFDSQRLTHVAVLIIAFVEKKNRVDLLVKSNALRLKSRKKRKQIETEDNNIRSMACKRR